MTIAAWASPFTDNVSVVVASFLNWVRTNLPKGLDGVGGGNYTPATRLNIDGAGLGSNNLECDGTLTVTSAATLDLDGALTQDAASTITAAGTTNVTGGLAIKSGGTLSVDSGGIATVQSGGNLEIEGTATLAGYASLRGSVAVENGNTGPFSFPAGATHLRYGGTPDAGLQLLVLPSEAASAGASLTVTRTTTSVGSLRLMDSTSAVIIGALAGGGLGALTVVCDGTSWRCESWSGTVTPSVV